MSRMRIRILIALSACLSGCAMFSGISDRAAGINDAIGGITDRDKNSSCYADPRLALVPGPQSVIDRKQAAALLAEAGVTGKDGLKDAARLQQWLSENFRATEAGGEFIGKTTARGLLKSRELTGCHDWALLLATLLRSAGYPARMTDTAGVQWMTQVRAGRDGHGFAGHVFVEAFIDGRWILLDSVSARYIKNYDHANPFIPMEVGDQTGYCVMFKGADPAAYGLDSAASLENYMTRFAKITDPAKLSAPQYQVIDLPYVGAPLPYLSDAVLTGPCELDASHRGVVLQFKAAGLDVNVEKSKGAYLAHIYRYGWVFSEPVKKTLSFSTLPELKGYLRAIEPVAVSSSGANPATTP